ncbi:hypothetical protein QTP70_004570 [Hemibagrus guttatus]|uniref:Reverse transcriptase domain-containing protein n=1 Tax=Hemibagrus guttatus TaxID=175788 RepID=A0AAE0VEY1_9TELE|nr:hypothetical protein QTP70_004570 [Hemibagrus guttatus]
MSSSSSLLNLPGIKAKDEGFLLDTLTSPKGLPINAVNTVANSHNKGAPGSKQYLVHWIVEPITQTYESYGVASPLGIRANTTRGNGPGPVPLHCLHCRLDMFSSASCHLQKFSDNSANVGLVTDDSDREYRDLIQDFVDWCQWNCLQINAVKTKELVVDFHRHEHPSPPPVNIQGKDIERVDSYKYLGVHLNNKLDWTDNTDAI